MSMSVPPATIALVHRIVQGLPSLEGMLAEHVEDNGEILPVVFLGQIGSWYEKSFDRQQARDFARRLDAELADAMRPASIDVDVQNTIGTGFLEMLMPSGDAIPAAVKALPPALRAEYGHMFGVIDEPASPGLIVQQK